MTYAVESTYEEDRQVQYGPDSPDAPPIPRGVELLEKEAHALAEIVDVLARRLASVLTPSEPTGPDQGSGVQPVLRAGLTEQLTQIDQRFQATRSRLESIVHRLEV
jgi:hypothetical protein